jgi:hypothetical protein
MPAPWLQSEEMDPRESEELAFVEGGLDLPEELSAYYVTEQARSELKSLLDELDKRKVETLRLYEPSAFQEKFHACTSREVLIQGGNRVGKSIAAFVEDARAATNQDPHHKYPDKGVLGCIGFKEEHVGLVIYRYLFQPGGAGIYLIQDERSGRWRCWKPWLPRDQERKSERKPAPPLIPPRLIENFVWSDKARRIFSRVDLKTGWSIYAWGSRAEPAQGFTADLIHIDEDLERPEWFVEMKSRLIMEEGRLIWSVLPHGKNDMLQKMVERAEDEEGKENPQTVVIRATVFDNPYMPAAGREEAIRTWKSAGDDVYRQRALGELVLDSLMMYPEFSKALHNATKPLPKGDDEGEGVPQALRILRERQGQPPANWARYAFIDPGHTVCAVAFITIPPPELGEWVFQYDELYLQQCDAEKLAQAMAFKTRDETIQRFYMDMHGGRLRELGSGEFPHEVYTKKFEEHHVKSVETGHRFWPMCDNTRLREEKLHELLRIRRSGYPTFLVVVEKCPNTCMNFARFRRKVVEGVVQDKRNDRTPGHAVECVEGAAAADLKYVAPKHDSIKKSPIDFILGGMRHREAKRKAKNRGFGDNHISLGPTGTNS